MKLSERMTVAEGSRLRKQQMGKVLSLAAAKHI